MVLVDKHDVAYVSLCFRKDTHISNKLYSAPFALLLDCVKPPRSANDHCTMGCKVAGYSALI